MNYASLYVKSPHHCAGNDFFRECGDVYASHAIGALDLKSELDLLRA